MTVQPDQNQRVRDQYESASGAAFYRTVMGDGGADIHYGLYRTPDVTMREATEAATLRLLELAESAFPDETIRHVVDLGAGAGGAAGVIAARRDVHVTCVDVCDHYRAAIEERSKRLGIPGKLATWNGSFDRLPAEWADRFDAAWSQEALCHAADKPAVFREAFRVLRPGGVLAFSDIMLAEDAPPEKSKAFTDVNAVVRLSRLGEYRAALRDAGFRDFVTEDWTPHLVTNFARMREQIRTQHGRLLDAGVPPDHLDRFAAALEERLAWPSGSVMTWHAVVCRRPR